MKKIIKTDIYDEFRCIAGQCTFTCCKGWDIQIDLDTINKWNDHESLSQTMKKNVKKKLSKNHIDYNINMGTKKSCPYLDENQLCKIVSNYSDDYLPNTCKIYPRQENIFNNRTEYSLTCGCPEVVDILYKNNGHVNFTHDETSTLENEPIEFIIREAMIKIMQMDEITLNDKLLYIFHVLLSLKDKLVITNTMLDDYLDQSYYKTLLNTFHETKVEEEDTLAEVNEIFLDMVYNYKREKQYRNFLYHISELGEELAKRLTGELREDEYDDLTRERELLVKFSNQNIREKLKEFNVVFHSYDKLIEQCMISKIFYTCICDDIYEFIISYQTIVTEYLMVKHSAFLKWLGDEVNYNHVRDYIVVYSRIIGYNSDGIKEFFEESFDDAIWDYGYLFLLLND